MGLQRRFYFDSLFERGRITNTLNPLQGNRNTASFLLRRGRPAANTAAGSPGCEYGCKRRQATPFSHDQLPRSKPGTPTSRVARQRIRPYAPSSHPLFTRPIAALQIPTYSRSGVTCPSPQNTKTKNPLPCINIGRYGVYSAGVHGKRNVSHGVHGAVTL